ncbi:response regulator [Methyloferula stellata]|uniref:response regulator n=1 Tax=Methyloferula stellata TaxID=876270 RepID=UPI00039EE8FD|nr:response regulator [Methyloferula stellata]
MQIGVDNDRRVENKRVFIIDNDGMTGSILQFMLEDDNETHEFATAEEAYAASEKQVYQKTEMSIPQMVIVGTNVLQEKGIDHLKEIAAKFPDAKIVVVAENPDDKIGKQCLAKGGGAHGALIKPLTVEVVRRKVDMLLGRLKAEFVQLGDFG